MIMFSIPYADQLIRARQEELMRMGAAGHPRSPSGVARPHGPVRRRLGWSLVTLGLRLAGGGAAGTGSPARLAG